MGKTIIIDFDAWQHTSFSGWFNTANGCGFEIEIYMYTIKEYILAFIYIFI